MSTTKKIFLDEYEHLYRFRDKVTLATGPGHVDETPVEKNVFDSLPAFREVSYNKLDKVSRYLYTEIEDVKNEDLLRWWHEHRHVFPHLYQMALDYHTIPCKFLFLYFFFFTHIWYY